MTKIPSVEEKLHVLCSPMAECIPDGQRLTEIIKLIPQALIAAREAGAREVMLSVQKIVTESRTVSEEYGIGNGEADARAQVIADIQALTTPTK